MIVAEAAAPPVCVDCGEPITFAGKPCGGSYISDGKTCRVGVGGATSADLAAEMNRRTMYHVTTPEAATAIRSGGIRASEGGYNAFGDGVYLSLDPSDVSNTRRMLGGRTEVVKVRVQVSNTYEVSQQAYNGPGGWEASVVREAGGRVSKDGQKITYKGRTLGIGTHEIRQRRALAQQALKDSGFDSVLFRPEGADRRYVTGGHQLVVFDPGKVRIGGARLSASSVAVAYASDDASDLYVWHGGDLVWQTPANADSTVDKYVWQMADVEWQAPNEERANLAAADTLRSPAMMVAIGVAPRFAEMSASLDRGRDQIVAVVGDLQAKQARRLTKIGVKLIKAGDAGRLAKLLTGDVTSADLVERPARLVPYDEEAAAFAAAMEELYEQGLDEYADEIRQQGVEPTLPEAGDRDEDAEYLLAAALVAAALLADRMANAWAAEVTRQMRVGPDEKALAASVLNPSAKLLEDLASQRVNLALSLGRALAAWANADRVATELYTAVMDRNTCRGGELRCWEQDGTEYPVGKGVPCPNPNCLGADRCRCVRVPVVAGTGR